MTDTLEDVVPRGWRTAFTVAIALAGVSFVPNPADAGGHAGLGVTPPPGGRFFDDDGSTHEAAIEAIAAEAITVGCNAPHQTGFCPEAPVTRAQMATFLTRGLGLEPVSGDRFEDVAGVHAGNINAIAGVGITLGCDASGRWFCPDDVVTRAQMASFLARGLGLEPVSGDRFEDVAGVHAGNINAIAGAGITLGCDASGRWFCPDDVVTRAQMASFLARSLDLPPLTVPDRVLSFSGEMVDPLTLAAAGGCTESTGEVCTVATAVAGDGFFIDTGWSLSNWSVVSAADRDAFLSDDVGVEAGFDGLSLELVRFDPYLSGDAMIKEVAFQFPAWLNGVHTLELFFFDYTVDPVYEWWVVISITAAGGGYPLP